MDKEELRKLAKSLSKDDYDTLQIIMENREEPVFDLELFKKFYKLIAEYPYLSNDTMFINERSIFKKGLCRNILTIYEIETIYESPFQNYLHKYCRQYYWHLVYTDYYKDVENPVFICPFTNEKCVTEDECFNGIFNKLSKYRHALEYYSLRTFTEYCRNYDIFPSIAHVEKLVSKTALEIMNLPLYNKTTLFKDSPKHYQKQGMFSKYMKEAGLDPNDNTPPRLTHWYVREDN